jgi:hypothetical protein
MGHPAVRNGAAAGVRLRCGESDDGALPRATIGAASLATLATNLRRTFTAENRRAAALPRREHRTRNMTICHRLPANFYLPRAARVRAASDRQTSPVRVSCGRPAEGRKHFITRMFAALRSARFRFLPCFPLKNRGETDATDVLVPLFAASVGVIGRTRQTKLGCVEGGVSLPFRCQGKNFPCRRSLVTAPLDHQPSDRYGRIANKPGSARCPFANLPCRQGKLGKAGPRTGREQPVSGRPAAYYA